MFMSFQLWNRIDGASLNPLKKIKVVSLTNHGLGIQFKSVTLPDQVHLVQSYLRKFDTTYRAKFRDTKSTILAAELKE